VYAEKVAPFICVQQGRHGRNMTPQDRKKARQVPEPKRKKRKQFLEA